MGTFTTVTLLLILLIIFLQQCFLPYIFLNKKLNTWRDRTVLHTSIQNIRDDNIVYESSSIASEFITAVLISWLFFPPLCPCNSSPSHFPWWREKGRERLGPSCPREVKWSHPSIWKGHWHSAFLDNPLISKFRLSVFILITASRGLLFPTSLIFITMGSQVGEQEMIKNRKSQTVYN